MFLVSKKSRVVVIYSQSFKNQGITNASREKQTAKRPPKTGLRLREQLFNYSYFD